MSAPIPYTVQSGETLQDIAKKLGIKDWTKLQEYHNAQAGSAQKTSATPYAGFKLLTPPQEEIYEMNGETPLPDPEEEQKNAAQKQDEEKKKEEEEKKDEQASKSEHDGKYFIVHNAKCICNQSFDQKEANLQVTSHSIIVLNDQEGKLAATEADKSFTPPMATFGKCLKKPMPGGGYYDCALTPAPKWDKTYESTQVMGKNTLTEISKLKCTMGGVITIVTHGQTDAVSNAHADNTNPVELAMVNPAIEPPKKKEEYPVVTSISLTEVEDRPNFAKLDSKNKNEVVYLRRYEEVSFKANLKSGNKQLTSWMVYSDHQGKKENRLFLREQIGVEFSQSFADFGKFRIEGYGKPKKAEFEKGKYDKCDPTCSIDVEVIQNTLLDIECTSADFTSRIDSSKNRKFRKGVPSVFKAKFFIQELTEQEKSKLTWSVQDGVGNTITEGVQASGNTLTFTPVNSKAKYTVIAQYINENGEAIEKKISGETEGNAVLGISHGAEIVRPGTSMSFSVSKMKYKFDEDNSPYGLTSDESSQIKWNLNGVFIGTGKNMTIPGSSLMTPGKYVIEAYSITANATGKNGRDEEDDWRFEVKENDVVSFTLSGVPKLGKPITATVDKMVFADLLPNESIHWSVASSKVTGKSITITPTVKGPLPVSCKINNRKGIQKTVNVVEAKITKGFWNDFGGSEISQAAWGQKVDFCVKGENIEGEEIELAIYDSDDMTDDDFGYSNTENKLKITGKDDKTFASHRIELSPKMKTRTTNSLSSEVKLYGKARLLGFEKSILKDITPLEKTSKYLSVNDKKSVYRAIIGEQNGRARHNPVDYDVLSWTYANTTYPKGTKLIVKIFEDINWSIDKECKELQSTGTVAEDGSLAVQINWGKLKEAKQNKKTKKYYAVIYDEKENKLLDGSSSETLCNTILIPQSTLIKEASYTGAVTVGSEQVTQQNTGKCFCNRDFKPEELEDMIKQLRVNRGGHGGNLTALWYNQTATNMNDKTLKSFTDEINSNFKHFGIKTCSQKMHFLAQASVETGEFSLSREKDDGSPLRYDPWRGHGLLQLTHEETYNKYAEVVGQSILKNPKKIAEDLHLTVHSGCWEWCEYKKMPSNKDSDAVKKWGVETAGKSLNELAAYGNTYLELISVLLNGRNKQGIPNNWAERESTYKYLRDSIFNYDIYHGDNTAVHSIDATDIVTFHIYADGSIEKHIPKNIKLEYREKYKYVYHDKENNEHDVCIVDIVKAQNWIVGAKAKEKDGIWEKRTAGGKTRYYKKGTGQVELVKFVVPLNYKQKGVNIKIGDNTTREYVNPIALASMLGAVAECGYDDFNFNGSASSDGTGAPSVTHVNGVAFDFRYLRKDKTGNNLHIDTHPNDLDVVRQERFMDALMSFGYSSFYSYNIILNGKKFILKNSTHLVDHNHHLHIKRDGYKPKFKEVKE